MSNKFDWYRLEIWKNFDDRYTEIVRVYDFCKGGLGEDVNKDTFAYHTKMLFENRRVFCSEEAMKLIEQSDVYDPDEIDLLRKGEVQEKYLQAKTHNFKRKTNFNVSFVWEHVVPASVIIELFCKDQSKKNYLNLIELGAVCIVTQDEDKRLTNNHLRDKMPDGWKLGDDIWARYDKAGIKVVK
ncbi:MAG: hypothetical protein KBT32_08485 [Bacteroidales bacterium]|nr:hypothetical protein [Candidatus Physcocola equi]